MAMSVFVALMAIGDGAGGVLHAQACQFTNNIAAWGGAIDFYGGRGLISLSTFSGNRADALGTAQRDRTIRLSFTAA
jgi:hypothetical protein